MQLFDLFIDISIFADIYYHSPLTVGVIKNLCFLTRIWEITVSIIKGDWCL